MYFEEELEGELSAEQRWWEQLLGVEREFRKQREKERASWEQEKARWRSKIRRWTIAIALLAIGVVVCGVNWGTAQANLADARAEVEHWKSVCYSGGLPVHFGSLGELEDWLAEDDTNTNPEHLTQGELDCDDYALTLQKHALEDGYLISVHLFDTVGDGLFNHMANIAVIGNDIYRIEPQTDGVTLIGHLDE